jgi:hypothetical protein
MWCDEDALLGFQRFLVQAADSCLRNDRMSAWQTRNMGYQLQVVKPGLG